MVFWILLFLAGFGMALPVGCIVLAFTVFKDESNEDLIGMGIGVGVMLILFPGMISTMMWSDHSDDLGTIVAQQEIIAVYEKQRDDMNKTLAAFKYPTSGTTDARGQFSVNVNVNADSPVRSIVEQLANVEKLLAEARSDKAEAIKSIEQRRRGPTSGVISFVGDYK
jgi:hypothetical protein